MKEIKETCYKGTRVLVGNQKRFLINRMIDKLHYLHFEEIQIPIIQFEELFASKVGEENNNLMFKLNDRKGRQLCLAPEYTAVVQRLAKTTFKQQKDVKLFYIAECFRGEKPQAGRYRQFTQVGVEILNPTKNYMDYKLDDLWLPRVAMDLCQCVIGQAEADKMELWLDATRGLDYYKDGKGFQIEHPDLGSSKQVCGGGEYDGGIGFAIGLDRLLNLL